PGSVPSSHVPGPRPGQSGGPRRGRCCRSWSPWKNASPRPTSALAGAITPSSRTRAPRTSPSSWISRCRTRSRSCTPPTTPPPGTAVTAPASPAPLQYGSIVIPANPTSRTVSVSLVNDSVPEQDEYFNVTLDSAQGADLAGPSSATVTIHDDDGPLNVQFDA